ncbi:MAG TPA: hypothetical protein VI670_24285 [Thermoanaerobaculia bacterium]|jgi:hypothetical protein
MTVSYTDDFMLREGETERRFQEIDRSIASLDLTRFADRNAAAEATMAGRLDQYLAVLKAVRPLLEEFTRFPLIPEPWCKALAALLEASDDLASERRQP